MATNADIDTNPENMASPSKGGFFAMMRSSMTSKRSRKSKSSSLGKSVSKPKTSSRRVVKATPPPENPAQERALPLEDGKETEESPSKDYSARVPASKIPFVEDEVLREKTEQWRKERLETTAANQKKNKEKEIMDHRKKTGTGDQVKSSSDNAANDIDTTTNTKEPEPVPAILTVTPKFPEHKRRGDDASLPQEEEPSGKKVRLEEESDEGAQIKATGRPWARLVPRFMTFGTVVAAAAIFAMKIYRRR